MIKFFIEGKPMAKQRARVTRYGSFTPKKTAQWEHHVHWIAKQHRPDKPLEGPVQLTLGFFLKRPKSISNKKIYAIGRSDVDNFAKCIMDALHGDYYANDNQIVILLAIKYYSNNTTGVSVGIDNVRPDEPTYFISHY